MLMWLAKIGDAMADLFRYIYSNVCCCGCCRIRDRNRVESSKSGNPSEARKTDDPAGKGNPSQQGAVVTDESDSESDDSDDDDDDDQDIGIPLTIPLAVIVGYIFLGALLFGIWEKWPPLTASYFCFITISTIGFGDVVPGAITMDEYKLLLSAFYIVFGMAILSMCFSLIQEEITAKFKWIAQKIGIMDASKPDGEGGDQEGTQARRSHAGIPAMNASHKPSPKKPRPKTKNKDI